MGSAWIVLALLTGCSTQPEAGPDAPAVTAQKAKAAKGTKGAKGKAGKAGKAGKTAKVAKAPPKPPPPVGAEGPVTGELVLAVVEDRTEAGLHLTFGTDEQADVPLGKVKGTCAVLESVPIGPEGQEQTPLWSVRCGEGEKTADVFILQAGDAISIVRLMPAKEEGAAATYRPIKKIPLVKGAELQRKG